MAQWHLSGKWEVGDRWVLAGTKWQGTPAPPLAADFAYEESSSPCPRLFSLPPTHSLTLIPKVISFSSALLKTWEFLSQAKLLLFETSPIMLKAQMISSDARVCKLLRSRANTL